MCQRARLASLGIVFAMVFGSCGKDSPSPSPTGPTSPPASGPPRSTGPLAFTSTRDGPTQIYVANADGSLVTRLTEGNHASWSPDGSRIAYMSIQCCPTWTGGIFVIDVDGNGVRKLVDVALARPERDYAPEKIFV